MVMGPDGFDLLGGDRLSPSTQPAGHRAGLVLGMAKEVDENVDDAGGVQFRGSHWKGELLSLSPLPGGLLRFCTEIDIGVLEGFPLQLVGLHQKTQGVVHTQMEHVLEFFVSLAGR